MMVGSRTESSSSKVLQPSAQFRVSSIWSLSRLAYATCLTLILISAVAITLPGPALAHLRGSPRRSQFHSLPHRYVICSPPSRGPKDVPSAAKFGSIYTAEDTLFSATQGFTECVAVHDGIIADVGSELDVLHRFCRPAPKSDPPKHPAKHRGPKGNKAARSEEARAIKAHPHLHGAHHKHCAVRRLRPGQTLFPGFQDAHGHILDYGWSRKVANLVGCKSVQEVIQRLERYVKSDPKLIQYANSQEVREQAPMPWLEGLGWDQTKWDPPVFPTAADLSESPLLRNFAISLRRVDVHALWLSEKALDLVSRNAKGFPASPRDDHKLQGGLVIRDQVGRPTGVLIDNAMNLAYQVIPKWTHDQRQVFLDAATEGLLRVGITAVGDAATDLDTAAFYKQVDAQAKLPFRIYSMLACPPDQRRCAHRIQQIRAPPSSNGSARFTLRSVKLFNDGALGSWGSAMWEDYTDKPGEKGLLLINEEELKPLVSYWMRQGWQVSTHAIGDRANSLTLDAYQAYLSDHPDAVDIRPRIEHAQLLKPSDLHRFSRVGVIASMQPTHCTSDMGYVESRIGPERAAKGAYAWKSLLALNASLALGSDFPVELPDPLHGIYSSITRLDPLGSSPHGPAGWYPHERLSRREALRGFTLDTSFAQFEEHVAGSILKGKRADFTLLDRNILDEDNVAPLMLRNAKVDATFIDGKIVYDRLAAAYGEASTLPWLEAFLPHFVRESALVTRIRSRWLRSVSRFHRVPWINAFALVSALGAAALLLSRVSRRGNNRGERYEMLSAMALNVRKPRTVWMNMGYWTDQADRPDDDLDLALACQNLAELLYAKTGIRQGSKLLDVGCGSGESVLLLHEKYHPKLLHAVTSREAEASIAASRAQKYMETRRTTGDGQNVKIWASDINRWLATSDTEGRDKYDHILALDCAYHFPSRSEYIKLASKRLDEGGTLSFVDVLSSWPAPAANLDRLNRGTLPYPSKPPSMLARMRHKLNCLALSVSSSNLWSVDEYVKELQSAGGFKLENIEMWDITEDVFPGFSRFLKEFGRGDQSWRGGGQIMRFGLGQFGDVVERWARGGDEGLVRCCIVVARKDARKDYKRS